MLEEGQLFALTPFYSSLTLSYDYLLKVAIFNGILFLGSIAGFLWILVHNAERKRASIADAVHLPLPGCPSIHTGIEWAQWVPGEFEGFICPVNLR